MYPHIIIVVGTQLTTISRKRYREVFFFCSLFILFHRAWHQRSFISHFFPRPSKRVFLAYKMYMYSDFTVQALCTVVRLLTYFVWRTNSNGVLDEWTQVFDIYVGKRTVNGNFPSHVFFNKQIDCTVYYRYMVVWRCVTRAQLPYDWFSRRLYIYTYEWASIKRSVNSNIIATYVGCTRNANRVRIRKHTVKI
jgi:hypothetical protein